MGTYGYDQAFFEKHGIEYLELLSADNQSRVLIVPSYQGRVMTTTSGGVTGKSYGWINYSLIESGKSDPRFNPYGGEDRFWLGPEGGPYSLYFKQGAEQVFENWFVPPVIDTEGFEIRNAGPAAVTFTRNASLVNASGTLFDIGIKRTVSLLSVPDIRAFTGADIPQTVRVIGFESENVITNLGTRPWTKDGGLLSIWILSMFTPFAQTTVFIPYKGGGDGAIVNDDYFGKVPAERLIVDRNMIFFLADGKYRSKIGVSPDRAGELFGSYDPDNNVLTLVWCTLPSDHVGYVNSRWGEQVNHYNGDAINSYNDGPVEDGTVMGPFYELETSSPALALKHSESAVHIQRVMHFEGAKSDLSFIVNSLFKIDISFVAKKF